MNSAKSVLGSGHFWGQVFALDIEVKTGTPITVADKCSPRDGGVALLKSARGLKQHLSSTGNNDNEKTQLHSASAIGAARGFITGRVKSGE